MEKNKLYVRCVYCEKKYLKKYPAQKYCSMSCSRRARKQYEKKRYKEDYRFIIEQRKRTTIRYWKNKSTKDIERKYFITIGALLGLEYLLEERDVRWERIGFLRIRVSYIPIL